MRNLKIPIDPANPGQFYACCGLIDLLALVDQNDAPTCFEYDSARPTRATFLVSGIGVAELSNLIRCVASAQYGTIPAPNAEQSVLPIAVRLPNDEIELDWWLDEFRLEPTPLKCWAGQVTSLRLFDELSKLLDPCTGAQELFHTSRPSKSKFGVDPRSAWNALDFGYSPNEHGQDAATFPAVEMLAAFGLQSFRPSPDQSRTAVYYLWRQPLPRLAALQACLDPWDGLDAPAFQFRIEKRGQSYKYFSPAKPVRKEFR